MVHQSGGIICSSGTFSNNKFDDGVIQIAQHSILERSFQGIVTQGNEPEPGLMLGLFFKFFDLFWVSLQDT